SSALLPARLEKESLENVVDHDRLVLPGTDTDRGDPGTGEMFDPIQVRARVRRQVGQAPGAGDVFRPPRQILIDRLGVMEQRLGQWHLVESFTVDLVADTDRNLLQR